MKTTLLHSYSSASLSNLSRSPSSLSLNSKGSTNSHNYQKPEGYATLEGDYSPRKDIEQDGCCTGLMKKACTKKSIAKKLPIISWLPLYTASKIASDLIAGLTVGLTLIPQGLAMASVANLPPQYGLYSGFIGCFVYILVGSTKEITIGPTAIMAIITLSYSDGKPPEYAVLLSFVTGVVTLLMGILQLGFIVNFISTPVTSGFTSAAAITICFTQVKALLGLKFPAEGFVDVTKGVISHFSEVNVNDAMVSILCIIVLLFLRKLQAFCKCAAQCSTGLDKVLWVISTSRSVIVIVVCTIIFALIGQDDLVAFVGDVVPGLPPISVPPFNFNGNGTETTATIDPEWETFTFMDLFKNDASALLVLPLLALMEHITCAKMFAGTGRVDANQEMISIGLSNLLGSFISSMPITGAFSRTVVNKSSGVESPLGGLVTGVLVIVALQFLTPYFFYIPKAALAAVICCAVIFTVDLEIIYPMWRSKKMDLLPWFATFAISLLVGLEIGVLVGFMISVVFLMYYAARPGVRVNKGQTSSGIEFILIDLDRSLTFPSVEYTRYVLMKSGTTWAKGTIPLVVDCQHIQFADFTAAQGVRDLFKMFNEKKHELILYQLKPSIVRIFTSIMEINSVPFKHCSTERELEEMLEAYMRAKEDKNTVKITFTVAEDDDDVLPDPPTEISSSSNRNLASTNGGLNGHVNQGAVFVLGDE